MFGGPAYSHMRHPSRKQADSRERVETVITLSLLIVEALDLSPVYSCIPLDKRTVESS